MNELIGTTLKEQYFLRELAGSGAMAEVYLAWDSLRATKMAVKILRRDLASNHQFYQAFEKEAKLLSDLQHPNIVRLYEFGREGDIVFIVMAWVDGGNLRQRIDELRRPFTLPETAQILQPICSALNFAHNNPKPAFHCDIKPSNIMLHENGRDVFLADFGVARLASEKGGGGTPPYMAPEQFSRNVGAKTDIYALGVTVYEMLSGGKLPYHGDSSSPGTTTRAKYEWEHNNLPLPPLGQFNHSLPQTIIGVVSRALQKEPRLRFDSALAFWEAFDRARNSAPSVAISPPPTERPTFLEPLPSKQQNVGRPAPPIPPPQPRVSPRAMTPVRPGVPHIYGRSGEMSGQSLPVLKQGLKIGRGASCNVQLHERSVSRSHATIFTTKRGIYVRDDGSALGTLVNGKRIPPNAPMALHHGDVIQIGFYQIFEFRMR